MLRPRRGLTAWITEWFWWKKGTGAVAPPTGPARFNWLDDSAKFERVDDAVRFNRLPDEVHFEVL